MTHSVETDLERAQVVAAVAVADLIELRRERDQLRAEVERLTALVDRLTAATGAPTDRGVA